MRRMPFILSLLLPTLACGLVARAQAEGVAEVEAEAAKEAPKPLPKAESKKEPNPQKEGQQAPAQVKKVNAQGKDTAEEKDPKENEAKDKPKEPEAKLDTANLPPTYMGLPFLFIPKLPAITDLDGKLDEETWAQAATVDMGGTETAKPPKFPTQAKVFCTKDGLYFGFRCEEPDMDGIKTGAGQVWTHDEIEIFLEPFKDTIKRNYHQVCVDADGVTWSGRIHMYAKYGNSQTKENWNPKIEATTHKDKAFWSMELHLPFSELKLDKLAKEKKTPWRLNMYRLRPKREKDEEAMQWAFSTTESQFFHTPTKFGYCLPEVYASNKLLDEIRAQPDAPPAEPPPPLPPELTAEIRKTIDELGSDFYVERKRAAEKLRKLYSKNKDGRAAILETLLETSERSPYPHLAWAAMQMFGHFKAQGDASNDEDPPPPHIVKSWRKRQGLTAQR